MKKPKVKDPIVSLGMSLGTFVKNQPLTPAEWAYVIEVRRLQIAEFLDRLTLPTIRDLLLEDPLCEKVKHFDRWFCALASSKQCSPSVGGDKPALDSLICPH